MIPDLRVVLLMIGLNASTCTVNAAAGKVPAENCDPPRLTVIHPLDFGDIRVLSGATGYLHVDPDGGVSQSSRVLVAREPAPGELMVCGRADQRVQIRLNQPSAELTAGGRRPVARQLENITLSGSGIHLSRVGPERWETRLPANGRARIRVGATLHLRDAGQHGTAGTSISLDVEPL